MKLRNNKEAVLVEGFMSQLFRCDLSVSLPFWRKGNRSKTTASCHAGAVAGGFLRQRCASGVAGCTLVVSRAGGSGGFCGPWWCNQC